MSPRHLALPEPPEATAVLARGSGGPGGEASFDGDGDRNLVVLLAICLLCSAGQSFSHQFDMLGILLSSKDTLLRESRLFTECQGGILSLPPSLRDPKSSLNPSRGFLAE